MDESLWTIYAEDFARFYYNQIDDQQHEQAAQFYLDNAILVWNGSSSAGITAIHQFLTKHPRSYHMIASLDIERLPDSVAYGETFLITTAGMVRFDDYSPRPFRQTFFMTLAGDHHYKITMSNYSCT